jgi:hypothetical protein
MGDLIYAKGKNRAIDRSCGFPVKAGKRVQVMYDGAIVVVDGVPLDFVIADDGQVDVCIQAVAIKCQTSITASAWQAFTKKYVIIEQSESDIPVKQAQIEP